MKYLFKQAVKIGARNYSLGFHHVPPEHEENSFFKILVKAGLVVKPDVPSESAPKLKADLASLPPQAKALAEKIMMKQASGELGDSSLPVEKGSGDEKSPDLNPELEKKPKEPKKRK